MAKEYDYYIIYVDEIKDGVPVGNIVNPCIRETIEFYDLGDMILKINEAMWQLKKEAEQSETGKLVCFHSFREVHLIRKPRYFFLVQMVRSNYIFWHGLVEGSSGPKKGFKSALDLMCRIDDVIHNREQDRLPKRRAVRG